MELHWGGLEKQAVGAWDRLAERVRAWPGTVIVSHEILATASRQQVRRALDSFGGRRGARRAVGPRPGPADPRRVAGERQAPADGRLPRRSSTRSPTRARTGELASWFWGVQEVPDILDRWGGTLPPERVHLVTVPASPAPPRDLLWQRFAAVLGLDAGDLDARHRPGEPVPRRPRDRAGPADQRAGQQRRARPTRTTAQFVRELLAHRTLSQRSGSPRLRLPADVRAWAVELSRALDRGAGQAAGTTWSARSTSCGPTSRRRAPFADPDRPDEDGRRATPRCESIVTLLEEAARLRRTSSSGCAASSPRRCAELERVPRARGSG